MVTVTPVAILTVRELLTLLAVEDSTPLQNISTEQEELFARLDRSSLFRAWQITVNLVYLMMNQLGVRPLERFLACYMVTRAAEDQRRLGPLDVEDPA